MRGSGRPGRHSGEGDSAGPCPHHPSRLRVCSGTAGAEAGRPGEGLVSTNGAPGTPVPLSWQKWPSRCQAAERSPSWLNCGFLSRLAAAWGEGLMMLRSLLWSCQLFSATFKIWFIVMDLGLRQGVSRGRGRGYVPRTGGLSWQ